MLWPVLLICACFLLGLLALRVIAVHLGLHE